MAAVKIPALPTDAEDPHVKQLVLGVPFADFWLIRSPTRSTHPNNPRGSKLRDRHKLPSNLSGSGRINQKAKSEGQPWNKQSSSCSPNKGVKSSSATPPSKTGLLQLRKFVGQGGRLANIWVPSLPLFVSSALRKLAKCFTFFPTPHRLILITVVQSVFL